MAPVSQLPPHTFIPHPPELRSILSSIHQFAPRILPSDPATSPTATTKPLVRTLSSLLRRQTTTVTATPVPIIPATYSGLNAGPASGTVVGIVFGSVAGFLLLLWLIYTCFNMGGAWNARSSVVEEEVVTRRRSRSPRRSSHSRSEVIEVSRTRERSRHVSPSRRAPSPSPSRSPSRTHSPPRSRRETVIIEESRRPVRSEREDDIVEVIEEHSPVRRERRSTSGRQSGYRTVDPDAFGGGNRPVRKVSRK